MIRTHCDFCNQVLEVEQLLCKQHRRQHLKLAVTNNEDGSSFDVCRECIGQMFFNIPSSEPKNKKVSQ